MTSFWVIIGTILAFLVMVSLHEFGHFIFGKLFKFDIEEYAIGFGPAIFKKQGKHTLYSIRIIPFGGYCRFAGEDEEAENSKDEGRSDQYAGEYKRFNEQPPIKRIIVLVAGALFNILLGFILFFALNIKTGDFTTNRISSVVTGSYMAESGVQKGDEIIELNSHHIASKQDIDLYSPDLEKDKDISLVVERDGKRLTYNFKPSSYSQRVEYKKDAIYYTETLNGVTKTEKINYSDEHPFNDSLVGRVDKYDTLLLGFTPEVEKINAINIIPHTWSSTCYVVRLVYKSLGDLILGKVGMDQVSGPVGIVGQVNSDAKSGYVDVDYVLTLIALLTINLGVMNLLPFPALDGGRLLFVIFELIFRHPVPREKEGIVHAVGIVILFAFMIFVMFKDIIKLIVT